MQPIAAFLCTFFETTNNKVAGFFSILVGRGKFNIPAAAMVRQAHHERLGTPRAAGQFIPAHLERVEGYYERESLVFPQLKMRALP